LALLLCELLFLYIMHYVLILSSQHDSWTHLSGPPPHTSFTWAHQPHTLFQVGLRFQPAATWAGHHDRPSTWVGHPLPSKANNWFKKVNRHEFEPKIYKVSNILLTTKLQFPLCRYSVFNVVILISAMHYQFRPKIS
jgi:hypothetical protein